MGRRGPAPMPIARLKLHGTLRKDRVHDSPEPPQGRPVCPSWLDDDAKAIWRQLIPILDRMGVLSKADRQALTRYCQLWSRWKKNELFIQKHGEKYSIKDERGRIKCLMPFPEVASAHKLAGQLTRLEQEFGLTPSARSRIHVPPTRTTSKVSRFFPPKTG